jgi:hypothetical protein
MKRLQFPGPIGTPILGGHPFKADDFAVMSDGILDAFKAVCEALTGGNTRILSGCGNITVAPSDHNDAGWIYHLGEIYPVDASNLFTVMGDIYTYGHTLYWIVIEDVLPPSPTTYADSSVNNIHIRRRMELTKVAIAEPGFVWPVGMVYAAQSTTIPFLNTNWVTPALGAGFAQDGTYPIKYRINYLGQLEIKGKFSCATPDKSGTLFTLPSSYRPELSVRKSFEYDATIDAPYNITAAGAVTSGNWTPDLGAGHNTTVQLNDIIIIS